MSMSYHLARRNMQMSLCDGAATIGAAAIHRKLARMHEELAFTPPSVLTIPRAGQSDAMPAPRSRAMAMSLNLVKA